MEFSNGSHLANYCLKIFKNKDIKIDLNFRNIILNLSKVYSFYKDLEDKNILVVNNNRFNNILEFCKNGDIDLVIKEIKCMIIKIENYNTGRMNFSLDEYTTAFLKNKENISNVYFPKKLNVLTIANAIDKAYLIKEDKLMDNIIYGVYFIYDENNEIVYIGKSISNVSTRCFESIKERNIHRFSKIEIRVPSSKSDVSIYEAYYISKYKPKFNKDLKIKDMLSIELTDIPIGKIYIKDYSKFKTFEYQYYTKEKVTPIEYFDNENYIVITTQIEKELFKKRIFTKNSSANSTYYENLENYKDELGFYYYEKNNYVYQSKY